MYVPYSMLYNNVSTETLAVDNGHLVEAASITLLCFSKSRNVQSFYYEGNIFSDVDHFQMDG